MTRDRVPRRSIVSMTVGVLLAAGVPRHADAQDLASIQQLHATSWVAEPPRGSEPAGTETPTTVETRAEHPTSDGGLPIGVVEVNHEGARRTPSEPAPPPGPRGDDDLDGGLVAGDGELDASTSEQDDAGEDRLDEADEGALGEGGGDGEVDFGASGEDTYDPLRDSPEALKARHWIIAGIVGTTVGTILGAGAIATAAVDPCLTGGGNNCFEDARNRAAAIMGVPAAVMVLGGVGMISYGAVQRRKLRASVASDGVTTLFTVQGRF